MELKRCGIIRDGGTTVWINPEVRKNLKTIEEANNAQKYYIDGRIGSKTKGELFDKYPSDEGAIILDKTQFVFLEN
jgi:hypothetical protein